jgi:hypothetical protein
LLLILLLREQPTNLSSCITELKAENPNPSDYGAGHVVVGFKEGTTSTEARQILGKYGLNNLTLYEESFSVGNPFAVAHVESSKEFEWICKLQQDSNVKYAELDYIAHIAV